MKETQSHSKDQVVIVDQKQEAEKKLKHLGTIQPHKGHSVYELNIETGEIVLAKYKTASINFRTGEGKKVIVVKENHLYTTSLNMKNAKRRFLKMINNAGKE